MPEKVGRAENAAGLFALVLMLRSVPSRIWSGRHVSVGGWQKPAKRERWGRTTVSAVSVGEDIFFVVVILLVGQLGLFECGFKQKMV